MNILSHAAGEYFPIGARAIGMANTAAPLTDHWGAFNNIASMADIKYIHTGFFYERRNGQFDMMALTGSMPTKYGNGALGVYRFGDSRYSDTRINFGWAHKINMVSLGIQAEYLQSMAAQEANEKQPELNRTNLLLNFGGIANVTSKLRFGAHIYNIFQAKYASYKEEKIPTIMKIGASFIPFDKLMINGEVEKDVEKKETYKMGMEYAIIQNLKFRTGFNIQPDKYFMGLGYNTHGFYLDYAVSLHQQLGMSQSINLSYTIAPKTKEAVAEPQK
ncbi:MAG: hypothetical protein NW207_07770 [Cytophagales bacterium]|nr:hypothetical protein [Cytophagales bacterium]